MKAMKRMTRQALPFMAIAALAFVLSGCDKCGDWPWQPRALLQSCKGPTPR
jgi:hypothetical protein